MPETVRKLRGGNLKKIYSNPELAKFSPRELIAELKARGYTGDHHLAVHLACRDYVKMRGVKKRNSRKVKRHKF